MITLNPVQITDTSTLLAFVKEFYAHEKIPYHAEYSRPAIENLLNDPTLGRAWWIISHDNEKKRLGYVVMTYAYSLEYGGRSGLLDELFLRPEFRGKGIGGKVFALVEAICIEDKVGVLFLEVDRSNSRAQSLYKKQGFIDKDRSLLSKRLPSDNF